ncbi:MAG: hypothetical protein N3A38_05105 [Planctomycetota bacterium]|nr:hypothetical protein [Planctomycetota bacterium]
MAGDGEASATAIAVPGAGGCAAGDSSTSDASAAPADGSGFSRPAGGRTPVPAWLPPALAAAGFFHAGYFWGAAAYILAGYTAAGRWTRPLSKAIAFASAAFWGIGTELYWSGGWSKIYPEINHLLKNFFGIFGISF